ncbi:MAG TPA: EAL domain-containing protein [Vicinamibacteria bacterium]|nr:EAL domain-containing protein [Vicinamibacteria bacterium]
MGFGIRSFQARLLSLMTAGLVLLQAVTLVAVHLAGQRTLENTVTEELRVGARVLDRILLARGAQLSDTVRVLAADFAFREVVASGDPETITSVLANHGARIDADAVFLMSLDGIVEAETLGGHYVGQPFPVPELLSRAKSESEASGVVSFGDRPHQFVLVPVLAPQPIALVCMGFTIDRDFLVEVGTLTAMDVSIWSRPTTSDAFAMLSTLPREKQNELLGRTRIPSSPEGPVPPTIELGTESFALALRPLETADDSRIEVLLQRSIDEARGPFRRLELQIFALSSGALLGALVAAVFLARSVSRPLHRLADGAGRIERGDYSLAFDIECQDEVGQLAKAFDRMRRGISEREEKIRYQAMHDTLTDLPNRTLFLDRLEHAIKQAQRRGTQVVVVMMDLDRFKEINDTLGHHLGDELLVEVARRLRSMIRESDTVARLGGDEFGILLETSDVPRAREIAQRVGASLETPFALGGITVTVNASMGLSVYPLHATDAVTLMKHADVAMYDAKKTHISVSVYEPRRDEHSLRRLAVLSELRRAVDDDQLQIHYQPKIDIASGRAVQAEALVRWLHPEQGLLRPDEFIPQAESSGKIRMITEWVLRRSIHDCAAWHAAGLDLAVAVNLSALDLYDAQLLSIVDGILNESGLDPTRLVIEVTESAVMKDAVRANGILNELKAQGIVIAIDDFGTGYSSLAHLRRLPVDELKIDKSFVTNLGADDEDVAIVRSTIELGHNLGLSVIAEGVENGETWQILRELRCDMAQGFFIARPEPRARFEQWMRESTWAREPSYRSVPGNVLR